MPEKVKRLRVLAGPNGSGKSTVIYHILSNFYCGYFINADQLHEQLRERKEIDLSKFGLLPEDASFQRYLAAQGKSWLAKATEKKKPIFLSLSQNKLFVPHVPGDYDAAIAADFLRYQLLEKENTFTFETVLSDKLKIDFLKEAAQKGFKIYLYFVCTTDPAINLVRVANRVAKKGHYVPPATIQDRYYKSLEVLSLLIPFTHRCFLFDNSEEGDEENQTINLVAEIEDGKKLTIRSEDVPLWVQENVIDQLF